MVTNARALSHRISLLSLHECYASRFLRKSSDQLLPGILVSGPLALLLESYEISVWSRAATGFGQRSLWAGLRGLNPSQRNARASLRGWMAN